MKARYGEQMELNERDIRNAFSTFEDRNQAYTRKYDYIGETAYLDRAVEKLGEFAQGIYPDYQIRKDLNVHELCFAIDSACTELAKNDILLLLGVFTVKPITFAACESKRGVTPSCIRQRQEMVVRNTGHGRRRIIVDKIYCICCLTYFCVGSFSCPCWSHHCLFETDELLFATKDTMR